MNWQRACRMARVSRWPLLATAFAAAMLTAACGEGEGGGSPTATATVTVTADLRDYTNFTPEAAMLSVDDLPSGFTELERRPPALQGTDIVSGTLFRFVAEGGTRYAFSEVVLLTSQAKPVVEETLRGMMRGLRFPDVRSATVDYPKPGSTLAVGVGSSELLGLGGPADTDIVFEALSFAEGRVIAMVGTAYPVGGLREPTSEALADIVLARIRAQTGKP